MKTKKIQKIILLLAVVVLFVSPSCSLSEIRVVVGDLRTKSETVELDDADSVNVEILMAAGELVISGGVNELLQADFLYNVAELEPEVDYSNGTLTILTPEVDVRVDSLWDLDDYHYEWDLNLNDDVPIEMIIEMGAGEANLELGSLSLTSLTLETGAADTTVDLSGSTSLSSLNIEQGVGEVTLNLTGNWQDDLNADISSGVGDLTLQVPSDICVRVDIRGGLIDVDTRGMSRDGNEYINDACGESDVTLRIDINADIGDIILEVRD
jgi:hypothetical protein